MTLREVQNTISGYHQDKELIIKTIWEASRFQVMHLLSPHTKKGQRINARDIAKFPWEKPDKKEIEVSKEKGLELAKKWNKSISKDGR